MRVVRGTKTLEQVHISRHFYMLLQGELVLTLPQPELSVSHSGTSFRTRALPRQEPSRQLRLVIWRTTYSGIHRALMNAGERDIV